VTRIGRIEPTKFGETIDYCLYVLILIVSRFQRAKKIDVIRLQRLFVFAEWMKFTLLLSLLIVTENTRYAAAYTLLLQLCYVELFSNNLFTFLDREVTILMCLFNDFSLHTRRHNYFV